MTLFIFFSHWHASEYTNVCVQKVNEKSARRRRKHCALAVVRRSQKFRPAADPLPGVRDSQNLNSWRRSLPLPTNPVRWASMHTISSYHGNRPHTHTHRQDRLQYTALQLAHCKQYRATQLSHVHGTDAKIGILFRTCYSFCTLSVF